LDLLRFRNAMSGWCVMRVLGWVIIFLIVLFVAVFALSFFYEGEFCGVFY